MSHEQFFISHNDCVGIRKAKQTKSNLLFSGKHKIVESNNTAEYSEYFINNHSNEARLICKKSIQQLYRNLSINKQNIHHNKVGVPCLSTTDEKINISLTHNDYYSASYISDRCNIGIDLEKISLDNLKSLQYFFHSLYSLIKPLCSDDKEIVLLTVCWTACESMFKALSSTYSIEIEDLKIKNIKRSNNGWVVEFEQYSHLLVYSKLFDGHVFSIAHDKHIENHLIDL